MGAVSVRRVSGIPRDATGRYDRALVINLVMAAIGILLICLVTKKAGDSRIL